MRTPEKIAHDKEYYLRTREKQLADAKKQRDNPVYKKEKVSYDKDYYLSHLSEKKAYHAARVEEKHIQSKIYREENKEEIAAKKKAYHLAHPEVELRRCCKKAGITLEVYNAQPKECSICHSTNPGTRKDKPLKSWPIDHDHITGKFRGLLCSSCNLALGLLNDDPKRCRAMAEYLENR
jgi:hypothetical protein